MARRLGRGEYRSVKRYVAAVLWFFAVWYAIAGLAMLLGVPDLLGPVLGLAAGVLVGVDPRHVIWSRGASGRSVRAD